MKKIFSGKAVQLIIITVVTFALSAILTAVKTKEYSDWVKTKAVITGWKPAKGISHIIYFTYYVDGTAKCTSITS